MPVYTRKVTNPLTARPCTVLDPTGAGDIITALTDGSDASYGVLHARTLQADFRCQPPELSDGEVVVSVCPYVRSLSTGPAQSSVTLGYLVPETLVTGSLYELLTMQIAPAVGIGDHEVPAYAGQVSRNGLSWFGDGVEDYAATLTMRDANLSTADPVRWHEAGTRWYTCMPASVAAPSSPAGTVTDTQRPTLAATVSAVVESWQVPAGLPSFATTGQLEFSVYRSADVGAATSPPSGAVPVWVRTVAWDISDYIDGATASTKSVSRALDIDLPNGTYVVYARAGRNQPSGLLDYSDYSRSSWTQDCVQPDRPYMATSWDVDKEAIGISVAYPTDARFTDGPGVFTVQRLVGDVWRDVRGMAGVELDALVDLVPIGYDYEVERGVPTVYRICVARELVADGTWRLSLWLGNKTSPGFDWDSDIGIHWNLKAVNDPSANWLNVNQVGDAQEDDQGVNAVHQPLDRERPVVVSGSIGGLSGSLQVVAEGQAAIAAAEALRAYRGLVLLETGFGDAKYIVITAMSRQRSGSIDAPVAAYSLTYTEVGCDLHEDAV